MTHFRPMYTGNSPEVKRIAIVGPECTGKTELARFLASHYQTVWVPEFARKYLEKLGRPYEKKDLTFIALGQIEHESELFINANKLLICDTTLLVIKIWSEYKYGECDAAILVEVEKLKYDLHLLTYVDIPWENDPQREHPHSREKLFELYKTEMINRNIHFVEIRGERAKRKAAAIRAIDAIL